jgi:hypothetical protein
MDETINMLGGIKEYDDVSEFGIGTWQEFFYAAQKIRAKLGVSVGVSLKMLRRACADGDVRALLLVHDHHISGDGIHVHQYLASRRIKPSEWRNDEPDIDERDLWLEPDRYVEVSLEDLDYWLDQQPKPEMTPETSARIEKANADAAKIAGRARQQASARLAIETIWPDGGYETLSDKQLERAVNDWIATEGSGTAVSQTTIRRALSRKK